MQIVIKRSKKYNNKVKAPSIHGKFPYKLYLELQGNSTYGKYVVVVSNRQLNEKGKVDKILIQLVDKLTLSQQSNRDIKGLRPNSFNSDIQQYNVKEVSILDVGDNEMFVFEPVTDIIGQLAQ